VSAVPPGAWADELERLRALLAREKELRGVRRVVVNLLHELHHRRGCPWTHIATTVAPTLGFAHATERRVRALAVQLRKRVARGGTPRPINACKRSLSSPAMEREKERSMGRIIKKQTETTWEELDDDEELGDHDERERDDDDEPEGGPDERRRPRRR